MADQLTGLRVVELAGVGPGPHGRCRRPVSVRTWRGWLTTRAFAEAGRHPNLTARGTITELDGVVAPPPALRLSRTVSAPAAPPEPGENTGAVKVDWRA